jgi:hypothetical protein
LMGPKNKDVSQADTFSFGNGPKIGRSMSAAQARQSRLIVVCDTVKVRAMAVNASPASRRAIASRC